MKCQIKANNATETSINTQLLSNRPFFSEWQCFMLGPKRFPEKTVKKIQSSNLPKFFPGKLLRDCTKVDILHGKCLSLCPINSVKKLMAICSKSETAQNDGKYLRMSMFGLPSPVKYGWQRSVRTTSFSTVHWTAFQNASFSSPDIISLSADHNSCRNCQVLINTQKF